MSPQTRHAFLLLLALSLACAGPRRFYLHGELDRREGDVDLPVAPGPWPEVPVVLASPDHVPDELVLPTLMALMALPGAADTCGLDGWPLPSAAEYCVAIYRTPEDWRVSWPIQTLLSSNNSCPPPYGGVEDADFGRNVPVVLGFAHNHPCGLFASSNDMKNFPAKKNPEGNWVMVGYGTTPGGTLARDGQGQLIPAWGWLATGNSEEPRFYRWNIVGDVFRWSKDKKHWEFQATCNPQSSIAFRKALPPTCSPELVDWY